MVKIIYLNGPSSSGKSTLVKALQNSLSEPYLHLGVDKMIGFMPAKLNNWEGEAAPLGFSWQPSIDPSGQSIYQIHAGPFAKRIIRTLKDISLLLLSQEYNLIIDDIAFGDVEVDQWKQTFKNNQALYVGVFAPVDILEERERSRGDRILGSARGQYYKVHENVTYDLEIDTHAQTVEENVEKIKKHLLLKSSQVD